MSKISQDDLRAWGVSSLETESFGESASLRIGTSPNTGKTTVSFAAKNHIESTGTYLPTIIEDLSRGDIVEVSLSGSAIGSEFYYSISEVRNRVTSLIPNEQIIMNTGQKWMSIATNGLFEVREAGTIVLGALFRKGDVSGQVKVFDFGDREGYRPPSCVIGAIYGAGSTRSWFSEVEYSALARVDKKFAPVRFAEVQRGPN